MIVSKIPFLDLPRQNSFVSKQVLALIEELSQSCAFIGGSLPSQFEKDFAKLHQSRYCLGVANGTDALEIAIEALQLPLGSEVIVPANTFVASAEAIVRSGLKPVFADVAPFSYHMELNQVQELVTEQTSAIMTVHLYGQLSPVEELSGFCKEHSLKLIEDCAQAHMADFKGKKAGSFGDVACFSFYPGKNLGAWGDAGAILFQEEDLHLNAKKIANHGSIVKYKHEVMGRNSRLDAVQAAVLNCKLSYLEEWTEQRREAARNYREGLSRLNIPFQKQRDGANGVYHLMIIEVEQREELMSHLQSQEIACGLHYPQIIPNMQPFQQFAGKPTPVAEKLSSRILSLPMGEHMTEPMVKRVLKSLEDFYS